MNKVSSEINTLLLGEDDKSISIAANIIKNGGLVAFPTETVYGLGGDALSGDSSKKIYAAKGRPSDNPLIVHIADINAVYELASEVSDKARDLMEAFWPGPLTVILPKKDIVPKETTGGLDTVAIRMPSHPAALALIKESGTYIAAPSANTSGRPSPTTAKHVEEDMTGRIDAIIDGGPVGIGIESTIVDMTSDSPTILRPGYITKSMLEAIVGEVQIDKAILTPDPSIRPKAPGMKYTHYAPKGKLTIIEDKTSPGEVTEKVIHKINELISENSNDNTIAVLTTKEHEQDYKTQNIILLGDKKNNITIASKLYAALRECDTIGAELIYSESICQDELGGAVMNRLLKAAGHRVIYL
ncbi:MAG TPA: threonylcarbamoyl-AMP synthase [Lachnospiraceae bacterium]|nr:threonylcarbamoyl-AMP synthase [Lachnospiraceae bacterium]